MTAHSQIRGGTVYAQTARFDTGRPLTEDEMRKYAPSIFAQTAHPSRSDKFIPIPTIEVLRALKREGFEPVGAKQSKTRMPDGSDFAKHLIRLRRFDNVEKYRVGDTVCEMLLRNANNGTAAYDLEAGLFRIACLNSLVTQTGSIESVKVRHNGKRVAEDVIEGTFTVLKEAQKALAAPQDWPRINLNRDERAAFAKAAHTLRFADAEGNVTTVVQPDQLLNIRRQEDTQPNLWTVFNVVQENAMKGGIHAVGTNANGQRRRMTTRPINGIDQDVKLNKALWVLAEEMAKLKG